MRGQTTINQTTRSRIANNHINGKVIKLEKKLQKVITRDENFWKDRGPIKLTASLKREVCASNCAC